MSRDSISDMEATCACLACRGGGERIADFYDKGWVVGQFEEKASFDGGDYDHRGIWQLVEMRKAAQSSESYLCTLRIAKKIKIPEGRTTQGKEVTAEQRKIGVIKPETTPMYAFQRPCGKYDTFPKEQQKKAESEFENSEADHLYKVVPLDDTRVIDGEHYRLNEYETPNTFSPWDTFSQPLQALYCGEDLPKMSPTSYTSDQTELLCAEYLRTEYPEFYPMMRTGGSTGTHEGLDILGKEDGKTIVGEVKNKSGLDSDVLQTLRRYTENDAEAYYFIRDGGSAKQVNIVEIETVLEELSDTYRDEMLEEMTSYDYH